MDRHRPGYYQEYAERTGRKDRHRLGYYDEYKRNRQDKDRKHLHDMKNEVPLWDGYTLIKDKMLYIPNDKIDLVLCYINRLSPYIRGHIIDEQNPFGNRIYIRDGNHISELALNEIEYWESIEHLYAKSIGIFFEDEYDWWDDDEY